MAQERVPANFLSLARELRQEILVESYAYESLEGEAVIGRTIAQRSILNDILEGSWTFTKHMTDIEEWVTALKRSVQYDSNVSGDVDYAKSKWFKDLQTERSWREQCAEKFWPALHDPQPSHTSMKELFWKITREGRAPWARVHCKLYLLNRKWWHETQARNDWTAKCAEVSRSSGCPRKEDGSKDVEALWLMTDNYISAPWDAGARRRHNSCSSSGEEWVGPSGVSWDKSGEHHPPSTWNNAGPEHISIVEAADRDVAWLQQQAVAYFT
ncbi:hypothetical protein FKW77_009541 [Venturia effusa]|uniref:Uncharacterized protein n=1 Tax=Venturia effusa TaxID=50376 RepID=A0A517LEL5_9PEZI|nr:hypothetical protein FKW77_009541 [Venturia effusa]